MQQLNDTTKKTKSKKEKASEFVGAHPDHAQELARLKRIKGQVEGIEKMVGERRYCPDIIVQIRAARAALQALEGSILKTHLRHCVKDAFKVKDSFKADEKIQEIIELLAR